MIPDPHGCIWFGVSGHERVRDEVKADLDYLGEEVEVVYTQLVLPGWGGPFHGFHRALYGYVMNCFAFIDLLSHYWMGTTGVRGQTQRMIQLMQRYLAYEALASSVAVQMWRHKMMHTANPQVLLGHPSGRRYRWLLQWREHLPRDQHMEFQQAPEDWILNIGLAYLVEDLRIGAGRYFADVDGSPDLQARLLAAHRNVVNPQPFDE